MRAVLEHVREDVAQRLVDEGAAAKPLRCAEEGGHQTHAVKSELAGAVQLFHRRHDPVHLAPTRLGRDAQGGWPVQQRIGGEGTFVDEPTKHDLVAE